MSALTTPHPFVPGDRVGYVLPKRYGSAWVHGRIHYVERCWSEYCPIMQRTYHYVKLLGFERRCHATWFALVARPGPVTA